MRGLDKTLNLATQTNLAFFNTEVMFGKRTFTRHMYFITFIAAICFVFWQTTIVWAA